MSKIVQILRKKVHWITPFNSMEETKNYPADCLFVEAPDYVNEMWGYNKKAEGDDRFVMPVAPEGWFYDMETGTFIEYARLDSMLEENQDAKQEDNKRLFNEYLAKNPLLYDDGKFYGVSYEDQSEIALNINQYQLQAQMIAAQGSDDFSTLTLQWHSVNSACTNWTLEQLSDLALKIKAYVYPIYNLMQMYKEKIYSFTSYKEVPGYEIVYNADIVAWIAAGNTLDTYVAPVVEEERPMEYPQDEDVVESEGVEEVVEDVVEEPVVEA